MNRRGWTLPELLVGTLVAGLLLGGAVMLLQAMAAVTRGLVAREEALETFRTVWTVLHQELGAGLPGRDWELEADNPAALRLRAFRGVAVPCGWDPGTREGDVVWRGHRAPDPSRDSVLVLTGAGDWWVGALEAVPAGGSGGSAPGPSGPCAPAGAGAPARWRLGAAPPDVLLLRYFEHGRYSLEEGAFRYRRGGEGRQPLTPERVGGGSRFHLEEDGRVRVELELDPGGRAEWWLPGPAPGALVGGGGR